MKIKQMKEKKNTRSWKMATCKIPVLFMYRRKNIYVEQNKSWNKYWPEKNQWRNIVFGDSVG